MENTNKDYKEELQHVKIPILILDQKWHQLFRVSGKPQEVKEKEIELNSYLQRQAQLTQETKDLKKLKNTLMSNIVENMDGTSEENVNDIVAKKLAEDRRLIDEINVKLDEHDDELLELPRKMNETNKELMLLTMSFCYDSFRTNQKQIEEISSWITQVRHDLKVNIIKKQNREINSKQMYSYMHDIFGAGVVNIFDLSNNDVNFDFKEHEKSESDENNGKE